jgi:hypothetical protein
MKIAEAKPETVNQPFVQRKADWLMRFFETLSNRLTLLADAAMVNIFSIILLIIVYLFYWTFPQAKDLLLTINQESDLQIVLFFASLVTLAGICWYLPRYFYADQREAARKAKTWTEFFKGSQNDAALTALLKNNGETLDALLKDDDEALEAQLAGDSNTLTWLKEEKRTLQALLKHNGKARHAWEKRYDEILDTLLKDEDETLEALLKENPPALDAWKKGDDETLDALLKDDELLCKKLESWRQKYFEKRIPRILSTAMLLLVTLGILNVGNEVSSAETSTFPWNIPAGWVAAILGSFYLLNLLVGNQTTAFRFNRWVHNRLGKRVLYYFAAVGLVLTALMLTMKGGLDDLAYLLLGSFLISVSFLIFAICRKSIPYLRFDSNIRYPLSILAALLSLAFVLINLAPGLSQKMNPLVCANLAFVFYLTVLYGIRFWGMRKGIYAVLFLFVAIFVVSSLTNSTRHHEVSYLENRYDPDKRLSLEEYFKAWVEQRRDSIGAYLVAHDFFPVLIVSAEGGGSRAAFWTSRVHGYIEEQIPGYYRNHLFALTGASGGTTGNSTFFAMKQGGVTPGEMKGVSQKMFLENFLSSSLTLLLGADLVQDVLGLKLNRDRGKRLEEEWSKRMESLLAPGNVNAFKEPFLQFWYDEQTRLKPDIQPLLLINTTQVQGAGHALVSPVRIESAAYRGMDLLDTLYKIKPEKTIPLVTANLLNASFPFINPAGHIDSVGSFVDAGYFDNYGARVSAGILKELAAFRASIGDSIYSKIKFVSVLIRNSTVDRAPASTTAAPAIQLSSQLMAPLSTISNIRSAVNDHNFWDLQYAADAFYKIDLERVPVVVKAGAEPVTPMIPLARYLSPLAIQAMDTALDSLAGKKTSDLTRLVRVLK